MKIVFNKIKELERIIEEHQNQLFSFAFFRVGSYEAAQDIVQDVFLKFYEDSRRLSAAKNVKSYLLKSIANACADYHRKNGKIHWERIENMKDDIIDEEKKECISEFLRIEDLLKDLPAEQAEVLKLKFVDGLNFVESAETLNVNVNTVKSRYKYALEKLKKTVIPNAVTPIASAKNKEKS
ncbi:MAG: RNA polymerase sigma factor [Flavobacteriaceae bacterium]|jgi:RNA polymerase sigma-70 factor (ECF subfamily)|nr:RNA polymerase sigma factor [Flavobacteriaceae bacterium]